MLESHGASRILASFHDIVPNWIFAGLYFSQAYIDRNPENIRKMAAGIVKAYEFIASHETEARRFLPKYTNVEEDLCMIAALREYAPIEPIERINQQRDLMVEYGFIKSKISLDHMLDYRFVPATLRGGAN